MTITGEALIGARAVRGSGGAFQAFDPSTRAPIEPAFYMVDADGQALVAHASIKAVGFTGSRFGGQALMTVAAARAQPIPVYAEMGSINPFYLVSEAGRARRADRGRLCGLDDHGRGPVLHQSRPRAGLERTGFRPLCRQGEGAPALFRTSGKAFLSEQALHGEIFGPAPLLVACDSVKEMRAITEGLEGQLTATVQMDEDDTELVRSLLPVLERRVGRILANGLPTGVEVATAMVHGGPLPATSDGRSSSVGTAAIQRFLRQVRYQNFGQGLLPEVLRDDNVGVWRRRDGALMKA